MQEKEMLFLPAARIIYGFDDLEIGRVMSISQSVASKYQESLVCVQHKLHSYARSKGKKFRTKNVDGVLYVKRIK